MSVIKITKENFEKEVMNAEKSVLVDFWADWCGPCKMMGPVIDEVADEIKHIIVGKINVDEQPELAIRYNVMSIPTLILFEKGQEVGRTVGFVSKKEVFDLIKK
jgi:thioredoxin 1